ncbi:MAG TPA: RNA polymerase sigma factor [Planctomycetota bacterium]|nr:RNA polymerase sigma factor [Planctomycetota bacterium]
MDCAAELALVQRAQAGDKTAFAALAEAHGPRLVRFLQTMTGDDHVAEDLRQDALQRALTSLAQLADPARFGSWLLSIACNRCRNHLRNELQRAHAGDEAMDTVAEGRRSALSSIVRREDAARLALAIDRLPILLREAFVLFVVEGLPYTEIAAATEVAEGTLQVRVHRAKALLRQQLGDQVDTWWVAR